MDFEERVANQRESRLVVEGFEEPWYEEKKIQI